MSLLAVCCRFSAALGPSFTKVPCRTFSHSLDGRVDKLTAPVQQTPFSMYQKHVPKKILEQLNPEEGTVLYYHEQRLTLSLLTTERGVKLHIKDDRWKAESGKESMEVTFKRRKIAHITGDVPRLGLRKYILTPNLIAYALDNIKNTEELFHRMQIQY